MRRSGGWDERDLPRAHPTRSGGRSLLEHSASLRGERPPLLADQRGAVFAEYTVVFLLATLGVAIAVAAVGLPLLALYVHAETLIGLPIP